MNTIQALALLDQVTAQIHLPRDQHDRIRTALQTLAVATQSPTTPIKPVPPGPPETK